MPRTAWLVTTWPNSAVKHIKDALLKHPRGLSVPQLRAYLDAVPFHTSHANLKSVLSQMKADGVLIGRWGPRCAHCGGPPQMTYRLRKGIVA